MRERERESGEKSNLEQLKLSKFKLHWTSLSWLERNKKGHNWNQV